MTLNIKLRFAVFVAALLLSAAASFAQGFEGEITMEMSLPMMGGNKSPIVIDVKGDKAVTTVQNPMGEMKMYSDHATHKMVMVMGGKTGYEMDTKKAEEIAAAKKDSIVPVATGQKKTINGYNCELYTCATSDGDFEFWMTGEFPKDIIQSLSRSTSSGLGGGMRGKNPLTSLTEKGLAPVETNVKKNGQLMATVDFVKYEKKHLDDSMFLVPADVKISPMPAMPGMGK